jgi:hypothetical protein
VQLRRSEAVLMEQKKEEVATEEGLKYNKISAADLK